MQSLKTSACAQDFPLIQVEQVEGQGLEATCCAACPPEAEDTQSAMRAAGSSEATLAKCSACAGTRTAPAAQIDSERPQRRCFASSFADGKPFKTHAEVAEPTETIHSDIRRGCMPTWEIGSSGARSGVKISGARMPHLQKKRGACEHCMLGYQGQSESRAAVCGGIHAQSSISADEGTMEGCMCVWGGACSAPPKYTHDRKCPPGSTPLE